MDLGCFFREFIGYGIIIMQYEFLLQKIIKPKIKFISHSTQPLQSRQHPQSPSQAHSSPTHIYILMHKSQAHLFSSFSTSLIPEVLRTQMKMFPLNIMNSRSKLYKYPRAHLKPLIDASPIRAESPSSTLHPATREHIFLSPQPQRSQMLNPRSVFLSHKNSENLINKEKLTPIPLKLTLSEPKTFKKFKETLEKDRNTPPHIKKLEKFWEKIGKISEKTLEAEGKEWNLSKLKKNKGLAVNKAKVLGVPARFKEISLAKSKKNDEEKKILRMGLVQDLYIIKSNNHQDLRHRIQVAKAARIYEENNREGILKRSKVNSSWRWDTPEGTPVDKTVKFDLIE